MCKFPALVVLLLSASVQANASIQGETLQQPSTRLRPQDIYTLYQHSIVKIACTNSTGSGFFIRDSATVITSYHVIDDTESITVIGSNNENWQVVRALLDPTSDLAILELASPTTRKPIHLAPYDSVKPGAEVTVISNPLGFLTDTVSTGVVSARRMHENTELIQFSAAISAGSSGGPVISDEGKAVGVVRLKFTEGDSLNIAVGSPAIKRLLAQPPVSLEPIYAVARERRLAQEAQEAAAAEEELRKIESEKRQKEETRNRIQELDKSILDLESQMKLVDSEILSLLTTRKTKQTSFDRLYAEALITKNQITEAQDLALYNERQLNALGPNEPQWVRLGYQVALARARSQVKSLSRELEQQMRSLAALESSIRNAETDIQIKQASIAELQRRATEMRLERERLLLGPA